MATQYEDSEYDSEQELDYLGTFQSQIVGIQYYPGTVNRHEMVLLEREPTNPYDSNAVRVNNIHGVKVGHLPRTLVIHLARLIDNNTVLLEASVPSGTNNVYKMPVRIDVYGDEQDRAMVARALSMSGCPLSSGTSYGSGSGGASSSRAAVPAAPKARRLTNAEVAKRVSNAFDALVAEDSSRDQLEPSNLVITPLYPHQKEALAWMVHRENSSELPVFWEAQEPKNGVGRVEYFHALTNFAQKDRPQPVRGGILADDMGLGKSLMTIALIATNRPGVLAAALRPSPPSDASESVIDLTNSDEEAAPPKKRAKTAAAKSTKEKKPTKAQLQAQEKADAAKAFAAQFEPPAVLPKSDGPKSTLILCPLSVVTGWAMQFEEHIQEDSLSVLVYHGPDRDRRSKNIAGYDVVISTYGTLVSEAGSKNGLNGVSWLRVVADEAHVLKNTKTQTAKAVGKLKTERKWGLTGTPIQNSLRDLHGLVSFLDLNAPNRRSAL